VDAEYLDFEGEESGNGDHLKPMSEGCEEHPSFILLGGRGIEDIRNNTRTVYILSRKTGGVYK
jgi:hypothetical protein